MLGGSSSTGRFCLANAANGPYRIFAVAGYPNRTNDIVYCPPVLRPINQNEEDPTAIVYFGGDVQDFPESMETNRDSRGYMKYNLENSAILLRNAFPKSHIIVVRPVRMEFKTFSCFDNFVRGNNAGVPDHTPMNHALQHLEKLLQNLSHRLISMPESELLVQTPSTSDTALSNDTNQDIDIDILQVQENITVDTDGGMIFPSSDSSSNHATTSTNASPQQPVATAAATVDAASHSESSTSETNSQSPQKNDANSQQQQPTSPQTTVHFNNTVTNDCHQNLLNIQSRNPLWWRENLNLDKAKLVLIGFSKGCVVLNQFIYEFHYLKTLTPDDSTMTGLLSRITDMYWLDGGHGGQKNTWITARSLLETLTRMGEQYDTEGINIHVHVTPYQVQDDRRPWIRREEKMFNEVLNRLCPSRIERHLHFDSTTPNLVTHFEVLQAFCQHIHMLNQQKHQQQLQQQQQQQQISQNRTIGENSIDEK